MDQENLYIDLHTHTEYSDGMYVTPQLLVGMAVINGIDVLAITDHDHIQGYFDAKNEAERTGVVLIPGTEITTSKYHLLGLNFNPNYRNLQEFLAYSREIQEKRCKIRVDRLREQGIPIDFDMVQKRFPNSRLGKYNVFVAMLEDPGCRKIIFNETPEMDFYQRFQYFLGMNGIVGKLKVCGVDENEAIQVVHDAGGIIGLAHGPKDIEDEAELGRLTEAGIDFLEIQPNGASRDYKTIDYEFVKKYSMEHNLPLTYGSDYHGPGHKRKFLGRGENILSTQLEARLNLGYVKMPCLEGVLC